MTENLSEIDEARAFLFLFSDALFSSIDSVANTEVAAIEQYYPIWRARRRKFFTSMVTGPLAIIKEWNPSHRIPYDPLSPFHLRDRSDGWCLEMLRFTRRQIVEMAIILEIPEEFENGHTAPAETALSLVCCSVRGRSTVRGSCGYYPCNF